MIVPDVSVHAVDLADQLELTVFVLHHDGGQIAVVRKVQLKIQRTEFRARQLLQQIVQNAVECPRQAAEQITKPVGVVLHTAEECFHIFLGPQLRRFSCGLARDTAPLAVGSEHILQHMLEHIVKKRAALRRVKLRFSALLCLQSVAHKIGKPAARKRIHARRGEADFVSV